MVDRHHLLSDDFRATALSLHKRPADVSRNPIEEDALNVETLIRRHIGFIIGHTVLEASASGIEQAPPRVEIAQQPPSIP